LELSGAADTSCLKEDYKKDFVQCYVLAYSPPVWRGPHVINFQSTLLTAPDLCKNVSHAVLGLYGSNGNSNTVSIQSDECVYIYIYICNIETLVGQKN